VAGIDAGYRAGQRIVVVGVVVSDAGNGHVVIVGWGSDAKQGAHGWSAEPGEFSSLR
jgi:hypothetical protein